jgi:pimeloyl-ACP methyl ester carboxylesterase
MNTLKWKGIGFLPSGIASILIMILFETIKKVKCPVLIVQGEKDFQVSPSNAIALRDTLEKSKNGKVRLLLFPNIDHLLKFEPAQSSELSYISKINRKVEPLILKSISSWVKSITA